ncbi:MAG TPA: DNA gyrase inhibitor YacG [Terriglobia bacterium]|nr:DNA gyrase inhibitor YacG [Terriglobia bacterium]
MPESCFKCPICGRPVAVSDPLLPFCSERCRLLDLGNWASGRYVIAGPPPSEAPPAEDWEAARGAGENESGV